MTEIPILREFTMTHDPGTRDIAVTMLVQHGSEERRYQWAGTYDPASGGITFQVEELTTRAPFPLMAPYGRVPVGPSRHRLGLTLDMDTTSAEAVVVPRRHCGRCLQPMDGHPASCDEVDIPPSPTFPVVQP